MWTLLLCTLHCTAVDFRMWNDINLISAKPSYKISGVRSGLGGQDYSGNKKKKSLFLGLLIQI